MRFKAVVAAAVLAAAIPVFSQVVPSATDNGLRIKVGAGFSGYNPDLGSHPLLGATLWADAYPGALPHVLHGWGLEAEARGIRHRQQYPNEEGVFRQETFGGGPIYSLQRYRNFRPYAKFLADFGSQDFYVGAQKYRHDTQMAYALGGGIEYRAFRRIWARADYEYQIWPNPFNNPSWYLDPEGLTVGISWELKPLGRH